MANEDDDGSDETEPDAVDQRSAVRAVQVVLAMPGADKLSLAEVARQAGVSVSTVRRVRRGLVPKVAVLIRLRRIWAKATAEEKRQFLDEVIEEGR
jgi:hypothetical protein